MMDHLGYTREKSDQLINDFIASKNDNNQKDTLATRSWVHDEGGLISRACTFPDKMHSHTLFWILKFLFFEKKTSALVRFGKCMFITILIFLANFNCFVDISEQTYQLIVVRAAYCTVKICFVCMINNYVKYRQHFFFFMFFCYFFPFTKIHFFYILPLASSCITISLCILKISSILDPFPPLPPPIDSSGLPDVIRKNYKPQ